jgi:hypothetical protein
MLKGALHIHTTYSDGDFPLPELREVLAADGCRFACLTDHADWFDRDSLAAYVAECDGLSDDRFRFIPGLEYGCEGRMHVLGYGVTALLDTCDPQVVIREIDRQGGVSVIAHPRDAAFEWIESFDVLPRGMEAWNTKYDGRYAPRPGTFALIGRLQARAPGLLAFYGQDLHWRAQHRGLVTMAACGSPVREQVLGALARGDFFGVKDDLQLPSSGRLPAGVLARFARRQGRSARLLAAVRGAKAVADRLGLALPDPLKAQMRRIF